MPQPTSPQNGIERYTVLVNGRHAVREQRLLAARKELVAFQPMTVEHFVSRLAGGFAQLVSMRDIKEVIFEAMEEVDLGDLDPVKKRAGMRTAAASSLMKFWLADIKVTESSHPRLRAMARLGEAVMERVPANSLTPNQLADQAMARIHLCPTIMGSISIEGMTELHPVWRPVIVEAARVCQVTWDAGPRTIPDWVVQNAIEIRQSPSQKADVKAATFANPRHEAVEALRWVRELVVDKKIAPSEIAVAAASPAAYDEIFAALREEADFPICMVQGIPALSTPQGQMAAALADILLRGITQRRIRRLIDTVGTDDGVFAALPDDWGRGLDADASLVRVEFWERALHRTESGIKAAAILIPILKLLDQGVAVAEEAGEKILPPLALALWKDALLDGPAAALDRTLPARRVPDEVGASGHPCYMSAEDLAASPRAHVRLVGLNAGSWPRRRKEDPLLPSHVVSSDILDPLPVSKADERDFRTILSTARWVTLSRPRRDMEGRPQACSGLVVDIFEKAQNVAAARVPHHAMGEADRLSARLDEYVATEHAKATYRCWSSWASPELTAHDGLLREGHPQIKEVLSGLQSASSLRLLLRDPLAFTWRYGMGWRAPEIQDTPLEVDARQLGNIAHDILRRAVKAMEPAGGFTALPPAQVKAAVESCASDAGMSFQLSNPVPPTLIWRLTMDRAVEIAYRALTHDIPALDQQKSYVESPFGGNVSWAAEDAPWDPDTEVILPRARLRLRGFIDRLDLAGDGLRARVVDYKTGSASSVSEKTIIDGGKQLQRVLYGFAVKALLGQEVAVEAALHYPESGVYLPLPEPEGVMAVTDEALAVAAESLRQGKAVPGPDAHERFNDMLFALPANAKHLYLVRKGPALLSALDALQPTWDLP